MTQHEALEYAIEELNKFADFMGAEGYFTYAKEVKGMVIPKLEEALRGNGERTTRR